MYVISGLIKAKVPLTMRTLEIIIACVSIHLRINVNIEINANSTGFKPKD